MGPVSKPALSACRRLADHLPDRLEGLPADPVVPGKGPGRAWGNPPVVVSCGMPAERVRRLARLATGLGVDHVRWFQRTGGARVTWVTTRLGAGVELSVPTSYHAQEGFLVDLSRAIKAASRS